MNKLSPDYKYYKSIFKGQEFPYAFVDLDLLNENIKQLAKRAQGKKIRVASKSIRVLEVIKRILGADDIFQGIMCYSAAEAVWLSQKGFDNLLMGYPCWHKNQIEAVCQELKKGKTIYLMVDLKEHVLHLNEIGKQQQQIIPVCIDVDMTSVFPGVRFGVWRSAINNVKQALELNKVIKDCEFVRLDGLMGYEAAIAGMGDNYKDKILQNLAVKFFKSSSAKEIAKRREDCILALQNDGVDFKFINGGGTGSLEWTTKESLVTEVTVGSGFFSSALFDNYSNFKHQPAAAFAVEIVRKPKDNIYTCHGGGYIASGAIGKDKQPLPYLPKGAKLIEQEGTGEVQTPVIYNGPEQLNLGDPIFLRHSKAGELSERFKEVLLVENGSITGSTPTYRGEGKCFV